jgi:glycosyltransferase involved in cell wall biosynthesis
MIHTPTVDIALATYNGEPYLEELLHSIAEQTYTNWQLIAGDDGSTDNTIEILRAFSAAYPQKVTLLPCGNRLGVKANFSRIMSACQSNYVLLADQDDIWLPNKIKISLQHTRTVEAETEDGAPILVHTDAIVTDEKGDHSSNSLWKYQNLRPEYGLKLKNLMVQNVITGCTMLINRPLLDLALPIPSQSIMHDWWLGLTAAAFGKISFIPTATMEYRQHSHNHIGAKQWSHWFIMQEASLGTKALKQRIDASIEQARKFREFFGNNLNTADRELLDAYIRLPAMSSVPRKIIAAKKGFHKCGILRTAGLYAAL